MAAAKRRSSARMPSGTRLGLLPGFSRSNSKNFVRGLGKAARFDFPNELQRCLGKAPAGGIRPNDGTERFSACCFANHPGRTSCAQGVPRALFEAQHQKAAKTKRDI